MYRSPLSLAAARDVVINGVPLTKGEKLSVGTASVKAISRLVARRIVVPQRDLYGAKGRRRTPAPAWLHPSLIKTLTVTQAEEKPTQAAQKIGKKSHGI